jgi:hypothetical protein
VKNKVEFYLGASSYQPFCVVDAEFQPSGGDFVNISGVTYKVTGRSFTVDQADSFTERSMRCNVIVEKVPE